LKDSEMVGLGGGEAARQRGIMDIYRGTVGHWVTETVWHLIKKGVGNE
jgi:hypothetical protein